MSALEKLKERFLWLSKYGMALSLLHWDQEVNMPPKGFPRRAEAIGEIAGFIFEKSTDDEMGRLIEEAEGEARDDLDRALVRFAKRDYERYRKIPKKLYMEFQIETAKAEHVWEEAKRESNFSIFRPSLERVLKLVVEIAQHLEYEENVYDALLDFFEPDLKTSELEKIVKDLRGFLVDMISRIGDRDVEDVFVGEFDLNSQRRLVRRALEFIGYDFEAGRVDVSAHPFTTTIGPGDVRITTRYKKEDLKEALYGALHEGGHALYEQGIPEEFRGLPIGDGASMAVHESQSRFWENVVGRSFGFWKAFKPVLEEIFPEFSSVDVERLWKSSNIVRRSLIRTEADEVTYNLHIMLRFELEKALVNGELDVKDLPMAWNEKMVEYLGIKPKNDSEGVLQDIHWAHGTFGYFPSYMLGNLYASQISRAMEREIGDIHSLVGEGKTGEILKWLRREIHSKARTKTPKELLLEATGEELNVDYFKDYILKKYSEIYDLR